MAEKIYLKGLRTFAPRQGAPDFVVGAAVITIEDLRAFFNENKQHVTQYEGKNQLRFDITKKQDGSISFVLNTYKQQAKAQPANNPYKVVEGNGTPREDNPDDLPF